MTPRTTAPTANPDRLFYCVVETYQDEIAIMSFLGRTRAEEKRFALTQVRTVYFITRNYDEAKRRCQRLRYVSANGGAK